MIKVSFEIDETTLPEHSQEELIDWLKYRLGVLWQMSGKNPLVGYDLYDCDTSSLEVGKDGR